MALPAYLAKQSTTSVGTGSVTLVAAASNLRSLNAAYGSSSIKVRYVIAWATGFEIGIGTYDGASPGTLTRDTALASSNAGALVNLSAGTKDVYVAPDFDRPLLSISGTTTLALADLGNVVHFSGSSSATLNLPAIATVPPGSGFLLRNSNSAGACLTLDPNGSETIDGAATQLLMPGESCEVFRIGSGWVTAGLGDSALIQTIAGTAVANIDVALPSSALWYEVRANLIPAGNAALLLRTRAAGSGVFAQGANDYGRPYIDLNGANSVGGQTNSGNAIPLSTTAFANSLITTAFDLYPGDGAFGARLVRAGSHWTEIGNTMVFTGMFSGNRIAAGAIDGIQLLLNPSGNFATGGAVSLYGRRR